MSCWFPCLLPQILEHVNSLGVFTSDICMRHGKFDPKPFSSCKCVFEPWPLGCSALMCYAKQKYSQRPLFTIGHINISPFTPFCLNNHIIIRIRNISTIILASACLLTLLSLPCPLYSRSWRNTSLNSRSIALSSSLFFRYFGKDKFCSQSPSSWCLRCRNHYDLRAEAFTIVKKCIPKPKLSVCRFFLNWVHWSYWVSLCSPQLCLVTYSSTSTATKLVPYWYRFRKHFRRAPFWSCYAWTRTVSLLGKGAVGPHQSRD